MPDHHGQVHKMLNFSFFSFFSSLGMDKQRIKKVYFSLSSDNSHIKVHFRLAVKFNYAIASFVLLS